MTDQNPSPQSKLCGGATPGRRSRLFGASAVGMNAGACARCGAPLFPHSLHVPDPIFSWEWRGEVVQACCLECSMRFVQPWWASWQASPGRGEVDRMLRYSSVTSSPAHMRGCGREEMLNFSSPRRRSCLSVVFCGSFGM